MFAACPKLVLVLVCATPHGDDAAERELRNSFDAGLRAADAAQRAEAVTAYSNGTRDLGAEAASRLVASSLARALHDESLQVQLAAVTALAWGRHPETAISALGE